MSSNFYRAFEDKFRGSRELILSRLEVYLPFINPLKELSEQPRGVDLGCGRGEWLELLQREGFNATGVDLDEGMLKACEQLHLKAHKADAIGYLESLPDTSVGVISAFHMVEHIPFDALQKLVQQALRVLVPGGLLIMETPNPDNLQVGAHTFYYDPTHQRPIPPLLLAFLPEHYGFFRTKVIGLQQDPRLDRAADPTLVDVLSGPSPDYAVVAQKPATAHRLASFDQAFGTEHGLTLNTLAVRYDASRAQQLQATRSEAKQATSTADSASAVAQQAISTADSASAVAQQAISTADSASAVAQQAISTADSASAVAQQAISTADSASAIAQQSLTSAQAALTAADRTQELIAHFEAVLERQNHLNAATEQRINALLNSTSWNITAPLRSLSTVLRKFAIAVLQPLRWGARILALPAMRFVLAHPKLRQGVSKSLKRYPAITHQLHLLAINRGIVPASVQTNTPPSETSATTCESSSPKPVTRYAAIELMQDSEAALKSCTLQEAVVYLDIK